MKLGQDCMQDPYWCSLVGKDPWSHWRSLWTSVPSAGGETIFKHLFIMVSWFIFLDTSSRQGDGVNRQCRNILVKHRLHVCANSNSILWVVSAGGSCTNHCTALSATILTVTIWSSLSLLIRRYSTTRHCTTQIINTIAIYLARSQNTIDTNTHF